MSLVLRTPVGGQTIDSEGAAATTSPRVLLLLWWVVWYGGMVWYQYMVPYHHYDVGLWYGMVPPYHRIIAYCLLWYGYGRKYHTIPPHCFYHYITTMVRYHSWGRYGTTNRTISYHRYHLHYTCVLQLWSGFTQPTIENLARDTLSTTSISA